MQKKGFVAKKEKFKIGRRSNKVGKKKKKKKKDLV